MNPWRALLPFALCVALSACTSLPQREDAALPLADAPGHQILVMLRAAPPHFRPDTSYAPRYESQILHGGQRRLADDLARNYGLDVVRAWPMPALGVDCFVMNVRGGEAIDRLVDTIARDARVESVQAMQLFRVLGHDDPLYPLQPAGRLWHLAEIHRIATGRNVRVAEVDTGVETDHPDLRGRVAVSRNFVDAAPPSPEAHGTAVAGIIAARADDGIGIAGIAPDARLYALRACQQPAGRATAICTSFTLASALQFAIDQDVQVINLSLGGPRDRLIERLLDAALSRNIVVVGAVDPNVAGGGFPAAHPGVLAVAAAASGALPEGAVLAPGRDVPTTTLGQTWGYVTGSSYSAAHISGAAALLLERAPGMSAAQLRNLLAGGGSPVEAPGRPGMADVCTALERTTGACACGCAVAQGASTTAVH